MKKDIKNNKNKQTDIPHEASTAPSASGRRHFRRSGDIKENEQSNNVWLISFTDVMALMLTFFVLLFSMTEPEKQDWSAVTAAVQSEFNRFYGAPQFAGAEDDINLNRINYNRALDVGYVSALMRSLQQESRFLEGVTMTPQQGRLVISLPRELLFEPASATVGEEGTRALYTLGGALSKIKNQIEIVGHADPRAIDSNTGFASNWELSLARAANVAGVLESVGYQKDVIIRGSSSGRYDDLSMIADQERRLDLSRRVDIIITNHDGRRNRVFGF
jgi:chemotaxis protein MotB